ncbi:MAG: nitrogenase [Fe-Mo] cofactor synthase, NifEN complex, NifE protein [Pseudomonadota bacterium]|jgi:nitrogenase molybdenum-cofactor synthesis protein NifE
MSNHSSIKDLYNEPACSNAGSKTKEQKSKCEKPEPGDLFSGCAFDGAQLSLLPFKDCAHIVHSPATCIGASWNSRNFNNRDDKFANLAFTTDININNLVFGAESKIRDSIDYVFYNYKPKAIFIYSTCVTALIGEDIDSIAKDKELELKIPITAIHSPGFVGSSNFGSRIAGVSILEKFIGTKEPEYLTPYDINLIGEYNLCGDMSGYKQLLESLNIRILSKFSGDGSIDEISYAHRAKLNILVNSKSLITMVRKMKEKWQIPWVELSFFGKKGTSDALRSIVQFFNDGKLANSVEKLIFEEEKKAKEKLHDIGQLLKTKKAVVLIDGTKIWQYLYLTYDSGVQIIATSADTVSDDDIEKAQSYIGLDALFIKNRDDLSDILNTTNCDILISTHENLDIAIKYNLCFFDIDNLKNTSLTSYIGFVNFTNEIFRCINNPVFKLLSKNAPWENRPAIKQTEPKTVLEQDAQGIKTFIIEFTYSDEEEDTRSVKDFERLTDVEDFFDFFDIDYDEQILRLKRYHIIKVFGNLIKNTLEIDESQRLAFYKFVLLKVYDSFVNNTQ